MTQNNKMSNAEQKVEELLEQIIYCDLRTEVGVDKARTIIRRGLKDYKNDTE